MGGFYIFCLWFALFAKIITAWEFNICIIHQADVDFPESNLSHYIDYAMFSFTDRGRFPQITLNTSLIELSKAELLGITDNGCAKIPPSCHGLVTIADCPQASLVNVWASKHVIPHVILNDKSCDHQSDHGIKMTPYYHSENEAITAIANHEQWSEVLILHDSFIGSKQKADLINELSKYYIGSLCLDIEDGLSSHMQTILDSQYRNIIVIARDKNVRNIFQQAKKLSMFDAAFFWLAYSDTIAAASLKESKVNGSNVVFLKRKLPAASDVPCLQVNGQCTGIDYKELFLSRLLDSFEMLSSAITMTSAADTISATYSMCSTDSYDVNWKNNISRELSQSNSIGSLGTLQFDDRGYPVGLKFVVCSFHETDPDKFKNIGYWTYETGLMLVDSTVYPNIFTDFGNRTLVIGALPAEPFNIKKTLGNITKWEGFCIDILDEMAEKFHFNYVIAEPADRIWGSPVDDGTWNGIVGQVVRGNYAFGVGPFTITSVRETVIDFTKPYMEEGIGILTRKPNSESKKMFKMFIPFAPEVWGCIVAGVIAVGVLLYIVNRITPYSDHKLYSKTDRMMLKESIWLVYGSYMEQGGDPQPKSISGRLILGFWWLFTILMTSTYTANLAAFLTVTIAEKPINSLTELSEQSDILPLAKYGSNLYTLFKDADGGIYQDVWNMMGNMPRITNNQDALKLVEQGLTAFMTDRSQLEYIVLNDCETYSLADESFNTAGLGFVMPENAVFSDAFNYHIMKMQEAGLIDKWKQKWWPSSDQCSGSDRTSQAQTLGLESLAGPFFIFLSVAGTAAILLLIELVYYSNGFVGLTKCLKISGNQESSENEKE